MMRIAFILSFILSLACASYGQMQMSMRGGGKPIYYPFQLDSLFYWFDAMDASSMLDSVGGAVSDNEGVATWADKSGNNWDVTQGTNTARPVYKATGGPGGNTPALQFDGSNDFLASAAHFWGSDDLTVFVVMKFGNATRDALDLIVSRYKDPTNERQWIMYGNSAVASYRINFNTAPNGTATGQAAWFSTTDTKHTTWKLRAFVSDALDGDMFVDGSEITATSDQVANIFDATIKFSVGAYDIDSTPKGFLIGSISEIIVFSRALTADERVGVEQYLKQKWGL